VLPASLGERVYDVVRVFLEGIVDARVGRRARPIVIDAKPTTDVDVRDLYAEGSQLDVEARHFL
jgi:hypothetical protein